MKLGIGTYCFMWSHGVEGAPPARPMSALDLLHRAASLGVGVVQLGPNLPLRDDDLDDIAARASENGISLELGAAGFDPAQIVAHLHRCRRLGASLLRTVGQYEGAPPAGEEIERTLRALLPLLQAAGVRLAVENSVVPARVLADVLDVIASPWLGVTLDTVNSLAIPEGTEQVVKELARHTLCLHIKDFRVRRIWHSMGFTVEGTPAGQGQLDIPWLLDQLRRAGRDPNAILELWVPRQETVEETIALEQRWVSESLTYLRRLIAH